MRWSLIIFVGYIAIGLQLGLGGYLRWHDAVPNIVLIGVIWLTLVLPRDPVLLGALLIGFMHDLVSMNPIGIYIVAYGVVASTVISVVHLIRHEHVLTRIVLALVSSLMVMIIFIISGLFNPTTRADIWPMILGAGYTALLAPVLMFPLDRFARAAGIVRRSPRN